ncbi:LOW QUALITY PROTEIN: regulator of microtubule dynamics protein 3, partial [Tachyglossus aculeatus]|uniref:LOW QUALITY PROTEIN: regulator of microtubule dynamics protein 3 n=1 Tax=Tachyglossus aculeatus TaxID=9261 RepID=UPI0018F710A6
PCPCPEGCREAEGLRLGLQQHVPKSRMGVLVGARGVVGLLLGTATGLGLLCALYIHRRRRPRALVGSQGLPNSLGYTRTSESHLHAAAARPPGEAGDAVALPGPPGARPDLLLDHLDLVVSGLSELRREVEELRGSLPSLAQEIVGQVRSHLEGQRGTRRRRFLYHRERSDSTGSSSIYFTASSGGALTDGESEGGYTTANAESDYEGGQTDGDSEDGGEAAGEAGGEEAGDQLEPAAGGEELGPLLQRADDLHRGGEQDKRDAFQLLLNNKPVYGDRQDFLWRLARAYSDMYELTEEADEKKSYAVGGKEEAEAALQLGDESPECHQWYAVLGSQVGEHEGIQKRIQSGFVFKEHVDRAISLQPDNPRTHFLLGRWCYQVAHLTWLERKTVSALYDSPPSASVHDALRSFLKVEELKPGFSKAGRVYISKCYKELGNNTMATQWLKQALELPDVTKEDSACHEDLEDLQATLIY